MVLVVSGINDLKQKIVLMVLMLNTWKALHYRVFMDLFLEGEKCDENTLDIDVFVKDLEVLV